MRQSLGSRNTNVRWDYSSQCRSFDNGVSGHKHQSLELGIVIILFESLIVRRDYNLVLVNENIVFYNWR
jgi:hypothetical protein